MNDQRVKTDTFKLSRTNQCQKCPWKVGTDPLDIPGGYSVEKHKALSCTISTDSMIFGRNVNAMACHHSENGKEEYCVGWLNHQLGVGNNIGLRIKMLRCENIGQIKTFGPQHRRFEDTLPKQKSS